MDTTPLWEALHREAHLAAELGFDADFLGEVPVVDRPGIRFANQGQFHPVRYLRGLAALLHGEGCHVFEETEAGKFFDEPRRVEAGDYRISFEHCVIGTHVPLQGRTSTPGALMRQTKLAGYSTYAVGGRVPKGRFPLALFWDTSDPYVYVRFHGGEEEDYVIVGGNDHKTGQGDEEEAFARLRTMAGMRVPDVVLDHQWSGQVIETPDGLPLIGETEPGEFVATGFAGNGMTFGTLAGVMARDWALGRANPWSDLFDVHRKKLSAAWDYLLENKDYPFYLAKSHLAGTDAEHLDQVPRGGGRIVRLDGKKVAVYRQDNGELSRCSAVCPHLGCVVEWNAAEKSWDCPCHGSRFAATGEVIAGPAESPLAPHPAS